MAGALVALALLVLVLSLGVLIGRRWPAEPGPSSLAPQGASAASSSHRPPSPDAGPHTDRAADSPTLTEPIAPGRRPAYLALVIDDVGRSVAVLDQFEGLGVPVTFSVLPFESQTGEVVRELARRGAEYLCHLPMEGSAGADPGPGALVSTMSEGEIREATRKALDAVPGAMGVNNHMGSVLSSDERAMAVVLGLLRARGLYFLDSRTTPDTVAYRMALDLGVPSAERQVFLDGEREPELIREQFRRALEIAAGRGAAVAIGHPYPETVAVLHEEVARARELGYRFVPISYLLDRDDLQTAGRDSS